MMEHPTQARIAAVIALLLVAASLATWSIANDHWSEQPWFLAVFQSSIFLLEGFTALLLTLDVVAIRGRFSLLWLAGGYGFTSIVAIIQLLTFPGIVSPSGGLGAGPQSAVWLWSFWHGGFPTFVLASLVAQRIEERSPPRDPRQPMSTRDVMPLFGTLTGAAVVSVICVRFSDFLPPLVTEDSYNHLRDGWVGHFIQALAALALISVIASSRLKRPMTLWLALGLLAFNLDIFLTLQASTRYTAAWYVARMLSLVSAGTLLIALTIRTFTLYRAAEIRAATFGEQAHRDGLTGLYNRRYLKERLDEELKRARRTAMPLSLLILDIDHFKRINDTYGHLAGDDCLIAIAKAVDARLQRAGDFTARYGGEEFVVVLPNTEAKGARAIAEEIRGLVLMLHGKGASPHPLTVSVGVATAAGADSLNACNLIAAADHRLYDAKRRGRNRVVADGDPMLVPLSQSA